MMLPTPLKTVSPWAAAALGLALLQGCASGPHASQYDPLEPFNRSVFRLNEGLDRAVFKPVATAYRDVTPAPVRTGVTSFFENLSDFGSLINNVLQAKPVEASDSLFRFTVNSFWGLGGIFDVASQMKIPKHKEDFGQTLGIWGLASGPYLVLPVLGSSTVRDSVGLVVDAQSSLLANAENVPVRNSLTGLRVINTRANLLNAGNLLDQAALDKYTFSRDIYLQRRQSLIEQSGTPPAEERYDLPERAEERYDLPEDAPATAAPEAPTPDAK
jgi:phospholipid-binding lipoprotein MlaA